MTRSVKFNNQKYLAPSLEEMGNLCFNLAKIIHAKKIQKFDRLIALAKGGLAWSRTLLDCLLIPELSSIQIRFYTHIGKAQNRPIIIQSLPIDVSGENILIFDDVADSGETLKVAKEYLILCGAKTVTTATLFIKTWTKTRPDFYSGKTSSWIIFPHDTREMINLLSKKWEKERLTKKEIAIRLIKIGLPKDRVLYFLH
jgi:hypoxanthine phosphoribosyltransferase